MVYVGFYLFVLGLFGSFCFVLLHCFLVFFEAAHLRKQTEQLRELIFSYSYLNTC